MANNSKTFFLPAEHQLIITTDAQQTGTLTLINNPGEQSTSKYRLESSSTTTKGPYAEGRSYLLESDTVELSYVIQVKLDFENESLALTAPDLNTPNIDGGTIDGTDIADSDISGGTLDGASLTDCDIINPLQTIAEDGAITLKFGLVNITKVTAAAITLAAPLAQDAGKVLIITSSTARSPHHNSYRINTGRSVRRT